MGSEWRIVQLRELTSKITKGTTPTAKDGGFSEYGVNYIRAESVGYSGELSTESFKKIDPSIHEKLKRSQLEENDILFSMAGAFLGKTGLVRKKHLPANTNQALALIRPIRDLVDPNFLLYFFRQNSVVSFVNGSVSQSAQPNINLQEIGSLNIKLPSLQEQQVISKIIGSLDNKIQLNRETNQTLEAMAQALFKSWFVDFDPVFDNIIAHNLAHNNAPLHNIPEPLLPHAQRRLNVHNVGRGSARQTASQEFHHLFPQAFEQSDEPSVGIQGWVPKGWGQSSFDKHTDFKNGYAFKSKELLKDTEDTIPVFKMGHIKRGGGFNPSGTKSYFPKSGIDKKIQDFFAKKGDLLMSMTDMKSNMVILGNTALMPISDKFLVNQRVGRIRPNNSTYLDYPYLYFYTNHIPVVEELRSRANSGVQVNLSTAAIKETLLLVPSERIHHEFNKQVKAFLERIFSNDESISSLESLRDTLLPKLISGELRIPDAEQASEALAK